MSFGYIWIGFLLGKHILSRKPLLLDDKNPWVSCRCSPKHQSNDNAFCRELVSLHWCLIRSVPMMVKVVVLTSNLPDSIDPRERALSLELWAQWMRVAVEDVSHGFGVEEWVQDEDVRKADLTASFASLAVGLTSKPRFAESELESSWGRRCDVGEAQDVVSTWTSLSLSLYSLYSLYSLLTTRTQTHTHIHIDVESIVTM